MLTVLLLAAGLTAGVSGCVEATTTSGGSPSITHSDLERTASGNKIHNSSSSAATPLTSGASASGQQFVVPDAAKAHTKEGAVAFVKFYWNTLSQLDAHPQTGVIPKFSAAGCKGCQRWEEHNKRLVQEKTVVRVAAEHCDPETVRPDSTADSVVIKIRCWDNGTQHVSGAKTVRSYPPAAFFNELRADWNGKEWTLGEAVSNPAK